MIAGKDSGEHVSLVEHPMPARALAAPMHRHSREDEYSFVLEGRVGAQLGDEVVFAGRGDLVFKPAISGTPSGTRQMSLPGSWT
jgi:quercetin dioxygenase-like cupin family protein